MCGTRDLRGSLLAIYTTLWLIAGDHIGSRSSAASQYSDTDDILGNAGVKRLVKDENR